MNSRTPASELSPASLSGVRILVVEDEPFIAFDIVASIQDAGAIALGPAATVRDALDLIGSSSINAAIVDVNLPDGHVGPVLDALAPSVAIVVHTGVGLPPDVKAAHPGIAVFSKPTSPQILLRRLAETLGRKP